MPWIAKKRQEIKEEPQKIKEEQQEIKEKYGNQEIGKPTELRVSVDC